MSGPRPARAPASGVSRQRIAMSTNPPPPDTGAAATNGGSMRPLDLRDTIPPSEPPDA